MPFPLKTAPSGLQTKPRVLLERPECAKAIALVNSEWALLEDQIISSVTFSLFVFSQNESAGQIIVKEILSSIESLNAKLDVIETLLSSRVSKETLERYQVLRKEIRNRSRERGKVAHGLWHICKEYPTDIILTRAGEEPMRYTPKCFEGITDRINATLNEVATFFHGNVQLEIVDKNPVLAKQISEALKPLTG